VILSRVRSRIERDARPANRLITAISAFFSLHPRIVLPGQGRATLHEWALIFYGTATLPDRTEYALYNPAGMNVPRRPFVKPRETNFSKSQNVLAKGKQAQHKSDKSGNLSPPYVVNAQIQSQRKGKARGQHKNGKSANRPNPRPTAQTLRGLTGVNRGSGNVVGDVRLITSRPRGRSTPSPITGKTTQVIATTKAQTVIMSRHRIVDLVTSSPLQRGLILLEPPAKAATNKVPAVFQQYPKIQQLYPVYGAGPRGAGQQLAIRAKGDLLQDEQFDPRNPPQLDKGISRRLRAARCAGCSMRDDRKPEF